MSDNAKHWLIPAGVGLLIVALVVVALVRDPVQLDPNTPDGTVQEYLQAISDGDYNRAFGFLDPEVYEGCNPSDLQTREPFSARLEESPPTTGDHATVNVIMTFGDGGPFESTWDSWVSFSLVHRDNVWWITEEAWPYISFQCLPMLEGVDR